jgi:ABC-type lipoprotein export system ATPase subunit
MERFVPEPILIARSIRKTYRDGDRDAPVLRGVDLEIGPGEFVAVMGPSGCGKTTLLNVLGLMTPPTTAEALRIDGTDCLGLGETGRTRIRRDKIGFVFQRFNLLRTLSARANVELALRLRGGSPDGQATQVMRDVGLLDCAHRKPGHLSIGEQQRVAIARAVACRPAILLADEPTGNLDSANAETVIRLFRRFHDANGLTVIMITHDADCAAAADRVLHMRDGVLEPAS